MEASAARSPRYRSTRYLEGDGVSFREALLQGLARDGGLFVPDAFPPLPPRWREAEDFGTLAISVLHPWLQGEIEEAELRALVRDALSFSVPLVPLRGEWEGVYVLELFHGPTLSFKDFGARTMARLAAHFLEEGERLVVLVATSGDTGSAVADGFAGLPGVRVVLLYPEGGVSEVQERQLIAPREGVTALRVSGVFDDCQRLVKEAFAEVRLEGVRLTSANSINVGRLLPQMLYYSEAVRQGRFEEATFVVPSGNLGNLTGGVLSWKAGLPVRRFVAAHNANRFFHDHLAGEAVRFGPSIRTYSNAMDVGAPSNFERLSTMLSPEELRGLVRAETVSDDETLRAMRDVYVAMGYVADPHTAVGLEAARRYRAAVGDVPPLVVLGTAHPAKFPDVVEEALGVRPDEPESLARLRREEGRSVPIPPTLDALRRVLLDAV